MRLTMKLLISLPLLITVSAQSLYLAGDSTMAVGGGGGSTQGWGVPLTQYFNISVVNSAVGGTSARSYSEQGRFSTLVNQVKKGDFVIIEFGHNDVSAGAVDNGKQDAVGDGYNITATVTTTNGSSLLIHSFAYYIENAVNALKAKGAVPIISSLTPDNIWTTTNPAVIAAGGRFVTYAHTVSVDTNITYVDHYNYVAQAYNALGQSTVATFYSSTDHLHTLPAGASVVAQAFVRGLLCGTSPLKNFVNAAGKAAPSWGQYLGQYLTIPVVNNAVAGRSARSYTDEGRFTTLINTAKSGDFVIIENSRKFGHNDGSSGSVDNGRQDAFGDSLTATSTVTASDGTTKVIHTFNYYMTNAVNSLKAKGAIPIVSAQTPDNIWSGSSIGAPPRFVPYAKEATLFVFLPIAYVDHYNYVAQAYKKIGQTTVTTYYPNGESPDVFRRQIILIIFPRSYPYLAYWGQRGRPGICERLAVWNECPEITDFA
ncbi:Rhamnogalacturonan acetylesterase [Mycena indigotica]|uniref:Rhamnogalacturonan acetylesterase n=1 Tax=Mycena indigotica TaxID=2126181 RepID=A0A8H6W601_9AGAR|nr:Rhamnogalacturonan acetylesterase [Mycena indigotica]KAF7307064.1 Rhamnogalacturonan acetylesterase [Mycena indigotica]